jgi:hypothetical protein
MLSPVDDNLKNNQNHELKHVNCNEDNITAPTGAVVLHSSPSNVISHSTMTDPVETLPACPLL